jgi:hypothetical protein
VLGGLISGGVLSFLIFSFSCSVCFSFELFLTLLCHLAGFDIFCAFVGRAVFPSSR